MTNTANGDLALVVEQLVGRVEEIESHLLLERDADVRHDDRPRVGDNATANPGAAGDDALQAEVRALRELVELALKRRQRRAPHDLEAAQARAEHARSCRRIGSGRGYVRVSTWRRWHAGRLPQREDFATSEAWLAWKSSSD